MASIAIDLDENQHTFFVLSDALKEWSARGFLATGIMVSTMVMVSFFLTGDRTVGYAAIAVGFCFAASILPVERNIGSTRE